MSDTKELTLGDALDITLGGPAYFVSDHCRGGNHRPVCGGFYGGRSCGCLCHTVPEGEHCPIVWARTIRKIDRELYAMKRHGQTTGGGGVHDTPPLLGRTNDDPARRVKGVAAAVTNALGEIERKPLMIALALRGDKRPAADPTAEVLDYAYTAARLTYPDGAWKEAAGAAASMAMRRARTFGIEDTARLAVMAAAGGELALAFLLHDRLPVGAYLGLVSPWLASFPHAAEVDGVGTNLYTEEEITMAQNDVAATKTTSTRQRPAKPAPAKPAVAKPAPAPKPTRAKTERLGYWLKERKTDTPAQAAGWYIAYWEMSGGRPKSRVAGKIHTGPSGKRDALAEAKANDWKLVDDPQALLLDEQTVKPSARGQVETKAQRLLAPKPAAAKPAPKPRTRKPAAPKVTAEREAELMAKALDKTVTEQTEVKAVGGGAPETSTPLPIPAHTSGDARRGCDCDYCERQWAKAARAAKRTAKKAVTS